MFEVVRKRMLNEHVTQMDVLAPMIAKKAKPGQFIMFRVDEQGERIPLTIADTDAEEGTVTIIFQIVGQSTKLLNQLNKGDFILDFAGPLGLATHIHEAKNACVIGGGVGCAIAYPQAKALHAQGSHVDVIMGFRNKEFVILEEEMNAVSDRLFLTTDDGSYGKQGFVTDQLKELIEAGTNYDMVIAIGPIPMMKFVSALTKTYGIKTIVSLNPIMVDGTGMCGACRVTVDGVTRFACVEGPDFDGHLVDFDSLAKRNTVYHDFEEERSHHCRLFGGNGHE